MFPNPQSALPLPPHPDLEQYKKLAKELVKACKAGEPGAIKQWADRWVQELVRLSGLKFTPRLPTPAGQWSNEVSAFAEKTLAGSGAGSKCALTGAQLVIARSHGFTSWPKLAAHVNALARMNSTVAQFEAAADAVVTGDAATLHRLLRDNPNLVRERSSREHHATLLHYTSANGVEGYRQKTPKNVVEIAEMLLRAGAEVDAEADVYGGGCTTLGLAATSVHPEEAGVQETLLQILLDHGASVEKPNLAGNRHSAVVACLANGRGRAAEFLAQHGASLDLEGAAGIGGIQEVKRFFTPDGNLTTAATSKELQRGFLWACEYGRDEVAEFLLEHGADLRDQAGTGETGLHWAVVGGHLSTVKLLIEHGAPLEELNAYGGTALGQAGWSFIYGSPRTDYAPIFEALLAAGAKIEPGWIRWLEQQEERPAEARARVAEVLRRYGATT